MLLILKPLTFVFLAVSKLVNAKALTLTFYIFPFICIAIGKFHVTLTVRLTSSHLTLIQTLIMGIA